MYFKKLYLITINKSSFVWFGTLDFVVIPVILIQIAYRVLHILERELLYEKHLTFLLSLWIVILMDKFLGTRLNKEIHIQLLVKTETLE